MVEMDSINHVKAEEKIPALMKYTQFEIDDVTKGRKNFKKRKKKLGKNGLFKKNDFFSDRFYCDRMTVMARMFSRAHATLKPC